MKKTVAVERDPLVVFMQTGLPGKCIVLPIIGTP